MPLFFVAPSRSFEIPDKKKELSRATKKKKATLQTTMILRTSEPVIEMSNPNIDTEKLDSWNSQIFGLLLSYTLHYSTIFNPPSDHKQHWIFL